ncbi:MFS transporter [Nonomuraea pusilla]|uniref:Predicted arabinose efflux permease, MFS family n=1 Tax=Nonomuraea pusilla TaxID=46177 RepID=A0A1H7LEX6_9ACTN|nr:MFS transporter [Nonomuraea pusilla]SEK97065.1 Predicted arabinose efflux permease, MFS family [Nonomuraea pusilla]
MTSTPTEPALLPTDRIRSIQRRTLGVLSATQIMGGVGVAVGLALSSVVVDELSGSTVISGFAGTATVLGAALLALPAAKASGSGGRRAGLALAYLAALAGCVVSVTAISLGSWPLLLAGLVLVGGGSAGGLAARYSATDLSPRDHSARHLSLVVWASTVGSVAGPNLAQPADELGRSLGLADKAGPFAFAALAFAAALAIVIAGLRPDPLKLARELHGTEDRGPGRNRTVRTAFQTLRTTPMARTALVMIAVSHTAMVSVMSMTPVKLHHDGSDLKVIGLVISLHIAGMYVLSPVVGWLADKAGKVPVLVLGMAVLLAAAMLAATAGHRVWQVTAALVLLGIGWSCGLVAGSALVTESVPIDRRPAVQGLSDLLMNVCGATGTIVAGAVVGRLSFGALGLGVGLMVTAAGLWLSITWHRTPA